MFVVPRNNAPYTVFGSDGSVVVYQSAAQLVKALGWNRLRRSLVVVERDAVGQWLKTEALGEIFAHGGFYGVRRAVFDVFGHAVSLDAFRHHEPRSHQPQRWPGSRYSRTRYMCYPKTYGERRMNAGVVAEDGEVPARHARIGKCLGDDRDDRKRIVERNWKSQRHHQWHD